MIAVLWRPSISNQICYWFIFCSHIVISTDHAPKIYYILPCRRALFPGPFPRRLGLTSDSLLARSYRVVATKESDHIMCENLYTYFDIGKLKNMAKSCGSQARPKRSAAITSSTAFTFIAHLYCSASISYILQFSQKVFRKGLAICILH